MVKRLRIHLGDCKTGTTAIQTVLKTGAWQCGVSSIYPVGPRELNHCLLASAIYRPREHDKLERRWTRIAQLLSDSEAEVGVISAEWFEFVDPVQMQATLRRFMPEHADQAKLISYIRPHAARIVSSFQERLKLGTFDGTLEDFFEAITRQGRFFFAPRLRRWREVFGDRFEVRPMVSDRLARGDAVHDFLTWAMDGAEVEVDRVAGRSANPSLSVQDLACLRGLHRSANLSESTGRLVARALQDREAPGDPLRLHADLAHRMRAAYMADARTLDAEYFGGGSMVQAFDAALEKAIDHAQSVEPEDHFPAAERRRLDAVAEVLAAAQEPRGGPGPKAG